MEAVQDTSLHIVALTEAATAQPAAPIFQEVNQVDEAIGRLINTKQRKFDWLL